MLPQSYDNFFVFQVYHTLEIKVNVESGTWDSHCKIILVQLYKPNNVFAKSTNSLRTVVVKSWIFASLSVILRIFLWKWAIVLQSSKKLIFFTFYALIFQYVYLILTNKILQLLLIISFKILKLEV